MKTRETTPGKTYSVHTSSGCTVSDKNGWSKTIYAPDGYFTAHAGEVTIDGDDTADIREVFKLAPYQKLRLLGVVGGNGGLPADYNRVEYIKTKQKTAFWTDYCPSYHSSCELVLNVEASGAFAIIFGNASMDVPAGFTVALDNSKDKEITNIAFDFNGKRTLGEPYIKADQWGRKFNCITDNTGVYFDGKLMCKAPASEYFKSNDKWAIATARYGAENGFIGRIYEIIFRENGEIMHHFVPSVDRVGAPCLFDLVGRIPYYNMGSEDAEVPNQSAGAVTTYSLRRPVSYAQLTPHGLRRLYKVPADYNGTKDEYAAEHGFKPLVKTESPADGYWEPRWTETEDEIVLEWVMAESPTDEFGIPEETLTKTE